MLNKAQSRLESFPPFTITALPTFLIHCRELQVESRWEDSFLNIPGVLLTTLWFLFYRWLFRHFKCPAEYHQSSMVLNSRSQSISGTLAGIPDTSINPSSTDDSSIHFDILGFLTGWLSDMNIQQSQDPQVRFLTWSCFQDPQPAGNCPRVCPQIQTPQNPP